MNNQPKDKCIECGKITKEKYGWESSDSFECESGWSIEGGEDAYFKALKDCPTCNGTGEGETKVYTHGSIEHEGERWIRSIDHENLIALSLQEQREEFKELIKEWIEKGFSLETLLDNVDIIPLKKELKNLE